MYIRNLVENTCIRYGLQGEHGLSFYIETAGHKVLFDLGASEKFWKNARRMQVRLEEVDTVILSHGHNDHGGGLAGFLEKNSKAMVYIHKNAFRRHYSDLRKDTGGMLPGASECADISLDPALMGHEHLVITENGRHVLFCGCGHTGIVNILENFRENIGVAPDVVVGGFHLSSPRLGTMADERLLERIAAELTRYEGCQYYTCHCTGKPAYEWLRARMGEQIRYVATGDEVTTGW